MVTTDQTNLNQLRQAAAIAIEAHQKLFLFEGFAMIALGGLAFAFPHFSTLAIVVLVGWLFMIGGFLRMISRFRARRTPGYWWSMSAAALAFILGLALIIMPFQAMVSLTLIFMALFLIEGISATFVAFDFRHHSQGWGWMLLSGMIDLLLAFLIWTGMPAIATWAIGMFAGINLFFTGFSLVMLAFSARRQIFEPSISRAGSNGNFVDDPRLEKPRRATVRARA